MNLYLIKFRSISFIYIAIVLMANLAWASNLEDDDNSQDECVPASACVAQSEWQIGLAFGLGAKSNPLIDSKVIPQVILLDIAWYGENAYFDNGEIGYKFLQTQETGVESYLTIDREAIFFNFWHPGNIFVSGPLLTPIDPIDEPPNQAEDISLDQISSRKWAVNAGLRAHYYGDNYEWSFSAEGDVSGAHKGFKAALSYQYAWQGNNWSLAVRPALIWKSDNLINYYYGVTVKDNIGLSREYRAKGGFQPAFSVLYSKKLNENWQWIASASFQKLHSGMTNSPIVKSNITSSLFVGAGYQF